VPTILATTTEIPVVLEKLCIVIFAKPVRLILHFTALPLKDNQFSQLSLANQYRWVRKYPNIFRQKSVKLMG
jgi:hypothetical protein